MMRQASELSVGVKASQARALAGDFSALRWTSQAERVRRIESLLLETQGILDEVFHNLSLEHSSADLVAKMEREDRNRELDGK